MKERYVLAICAAAGFVLTAGLARWRSGGVAEELAHAQAPARAAAVEAPRLAPPPAPPAAAAVPPPAPPAPTAPQPGARPRADNLTDHSDWRLEQQARRLARRAAEREGH